MDSKAEYSALSSTRSQKKNIVACNVFFDCTVPLFFLFHSFNVLESRLLCAMTKL